MTSPPSPITLLQEGHFLQGDAFAQQHLDASRPVGKGKNFQLLNPNQPQFAAREFVQHHREAAGEPKAPGSAAQPCDIFLSRFPASLSYGPSPLGSPSSHSAFLRNPGHPLGNPRLSQGVCKRNAANTGRGVADESLLCLFKPFHGEQEVQHWAMGDTDLPGHRPRAPQ